MLIINLNKTIGNLTNLMVFLIIIAGAIAVIKSLLEKKDIFDISLTVISVALSVYLVKNIGAWANIGEMIYNMGIAILEAVLKGVC